MITRRGGGALRLRGVAMMALLLTTGCAATPRTADHAAPYDAYRQLRQLHDEPHCDHRVQLLRSRSEAVHPYRQIASLSATCSPGALSVCEREMLDRACALGADAIILDPHARRGTPWNASNQPLALSSALAVRWTDR